MRYREKLDIIIMRDNGPRRSFHIRRSNFFLLLILFLCLPFLCLLLTIQCWLLWHENTDLRFSMERAEAECQTLAARAERLENLEELLKEENTRARDVLVRQLAESPGSAETEAAPEEHGQEEREPEEFQGVDSGRVKVSNVQTRILRGNALRISLDLRNLDSDTLVSGEVEAILVLRNGEELGLAFNPREAGAFKIARFKRTVLTTQAPKGASLTDARLILEVKEHGNKLIFRNIYPLNQ